MGLRVGFLTLSALVITCAAPLACNFGISLDCLSGPCDGGADGNIPPVGGASISAGENAACVVRQDGTIACWGQGDQLGNGTFQDSSSPVLVQGVNDATQVSVGHNHACAIRKSGQLICWGRNDYGQLGNGSTSDSSSPVMVTTIPDATVVSAGSQATCAARADGTVYCWGLDESGQIGIGSTATSVPLPQQAIGVTDAISVAVGYSHACAATKSGAVWCWGAGDYGENGGTAGLTTPTQVAGISNAATVGAGDYYTCAMTTDGHVSCWGASWDGRLGNPAAKTGNTVSDTGLSTVTALSVGAWHSCVVKADATVACWGGNGFGECGVGAHGGSISVPVPVASLSGVSAVGAGSPQTCSLLSSGKVMCWGGNFNGDLGQGTLVLATQPNDVSGESSVADVACGDDFTCSARKDGSVACWGDNESSQLAVATPLLTATPTVVAGLSGIAKIRSGPYSQMACAMDGSNAVTCWGDNQYGALGHDSNGDPSLPAPFGVTATQLVVGYKHICALATDGTVPCAGQNYDGQLGNGTTSGTSSTPTAAQGVAGVTLLGGGTGHNCALGTGGLLCWGDDDSAQLGDGKSPGGIGTPQKATAVTFAPSSIAGGADFTCAIDPAGDVYCFGTGGSGQMGSGSISGSSTPVKVLSLTKPAVQLALGYAHACARLSDNSVSCWGDDTAGQLGNAQVLAYATASPVKNLTDAVTICAGSWHTCAVRASGQLVCWGSNSSGQLGDGTTMIMDTPQPVSGF